MTTTRFLDTLEQAPAGKEVSAAAAADSFAAEVAATKKVTMSNILAFGVVSRKTVEKHIKAGFLAGRKVKVRGVDTWLFEPLAAQAYLEQVVALTTASVRNRVPKGKAVAPAGFLTVAELCARTGLSRWAIYDALADGRLEVARTGQRGAKLFTQAEADRFVAAAPAARPQQRKESRTPRPSVAPPGARERRPLRVNDRLVLLLLVLDQEGETPTVLAKSLGLAAQTVRNWATGVSLPDDGNTGRLVAYARGRYALRVGGALDALGKQHRADYMTSYMRERRATADETLEASR